MSTIIPTIPPMEAPTLDRYLTRNDVAEMFSISVRTVENWRANGTLPKSFQLGGRTYWKEEKIRGAVDELIANNAANDACGKLVDISRLGRVREPKAGNAVAKSLVRDQKKLMDLMAD